MEISTPAWPEAHDGLRIGHVSDLHFGDLMSYDMAMHVIDVLRAESPEMICNTGDLVDLEWQGIEPVVEGFVSLSPPLGNYFVLGNHDELDSADDVVRIAEDAGLCVLRDSVKETVRNGHPLSIGGVDWARTPAQCRTRIDRMLQDGTPQILLCHNPKGFDHAAASGIPLTLSGHTHGGQIARRNRPDANMAFSHRRSAGLYEIDDQRLFVTVGVGSWFPVRMNCPAEVVIITLRHGKPCATHD